MQTEIEKELHTEFLHAYDFVECHEGALPYDLAVLSEEAIVEGSRKSIFSRILEWLGNNAFTPREARILREDFWLARPDFLLEAFDRCETAKGIVVDATSGKYFYLLTTEAEQLRADLLEALRGMLRAHPLPALA